VYRGTTGLLNLICKPSLAADQSCSNLSRCNKNKVKILASAGDIFKLCRCLNCSITTVCYKYLKRESSTEGRIVLCKYFLQIVCNNCHLNFTKITHPMFFTLYFECKCLFLKNTPPQLNTGSVTLHQGVYLANFNSLLWKSQSKVHHGTW